jgi:hypothetical protein
MPDKLLMVGQGLVCYLIPCATAALTGLGLLRLLRLDKGLLINSLLAPVVTLVFWTLSVDIAVAAGLTVGQAAPWVWGASALLGIYALRRPRPSLRAVAPLLLCLALPAVVMAGPFSEGLTQYTGTIVRDGWHYIARARFLWDHPLHGSDESPLCYHVSGSRVGPDYRYTSSALIAFLSPLVRRGDSLAAISVFQAWSLFSVACAAYLFWVAHGQNPWAAAAATALAVLGGWTADAVWAMNCDNLLAVIYIPAIGAIVTLLEPRNPRWWVLLGVVAAGVPYTYPEGGALLVVGTGLLILPRTWQARADWRDWLLGGSIAGLAAVLAFVPLATLTTVIANARGNLISARLFQPGQRCGEGYFPGLLRREFQPAALWALGGETQTKAHSAVLNYWGVALSALLLVGLGILARRRRWGPLAVCLFCLTGAAIMLFRERYDYGAYKFLLLGWWCLTGVVVLGAVGVIGRVPTWLGKRAAAAGLGAAACLLTNPFVPNHFYAGLTPFESHPADEFRKPLRELARANPGPVVISAGDLVANLLAVYYLRDMPTHIGAPVAAYSLFPPIVESRPLTGVSYCLTDHGSQGLLDPAVPRQLVWSAGPYELWKYDRTGRQPLVIGIRNMNGVFSYLGQSFWLATDETSLEILCDDPGVLQFKAIFIPGPWLPGLTACRVLVTTDAGCQNQIAMTAGPGEFLIPVHPGVNRVALRSLDPPTPTVLPNGDPRPLLLGVVGIRLSLTGAPAGS